MKKPHRLLAFRVDPILALMPAVCLLSGCNYFILLGYLIGGPPSIEPDFDSMTKKSMTDKDVTVAVVCYAPTELKYDFDNVDREVAKYVSFRLGQHQIQFANPDIVWAWLDRNPDWDRPEEVGEALDVNYVVYIDLHAFSMFEEGSQTLYRGRAEAMVSVFEMAEDGSGDKIYSKEITSQYPIRAPRSSSEVTYPTFKKQYLSRLSEEIGRLFFEHYAGDDIPDAV